MPSNAENIAAINAQIAAVDAKILDLVTNFSPPYDIDQQAVDTSRGLESLNKVRDELLARLIRYQPFRFRSRGC